MNDKKTTIQEFLDLLHKENINEKSAQNDYDEVFGKDSLFSIVCNKCGNTNIEIIGEAGIDYGGQTGYQEGYTAIKCNKCGSAETIHH
jgi:ribosomal protein S27E